MPERKKASAPRRGSKGAFEKIRGDVQKRMTKMLGAVNIDDNGDFSFQNESTRVFVRPVQRDRAVVVSVYAFTNLEVPPSPELFHFIATRADDFVIGHLSAYESERGVDMALSHRLMGEHMAPGELEAAIAAIATSANEIDDKIHSMFGGRVFHPTDPIPETKLTGAAGAAGYL